MSTAKTDEPLIARLALDTIHLANSQAWATITSALKDAKVGKRSGELRTAAWTFRAALKKQKPAPKK